MNLSLERYYQIWRDAIAKADLSDDLRAGVLANIDLCAFKGFHLLIITVPPQNSVSLYNGNAYIREGDETVTASAAKLLAIAGRFGVG
jgi:predicted HTH transcriptional regulator